MKVIIVVIKALLVLGVTVASLLLMLWAYSSLLIMTLDILVAFLPIPAIGFLLVFLCTFILGYGSETQEAPVQTKETRRGDNEVMG